VFRLEASRFRFRAKPRHEDLRPSTGSFLDVRVLDSSRLETLREELETISALVDAVVIVGDLNVHHASWLRFANGDAPRGRLLKDVCDSFGLRQLVAQPTRGEYLLDLALSSSAGVSVKVERVFACQGT